VGGGTAIAADPQTRSRDVLALERTFLAWLRTGVTVMVLGLAIARFPTHAGPRELAAGAILVATGALGIFEGLRRYRSQLAQIESGAPIDVSGLVVPAVVLVGAVFAALILLLI
jgi:putative membrane protein